MVNLDVDVMRTSVIIGMVMLLKAHLKALYGLTEEYANASEVIPLDLPFIVENAVNSFLGKRVPSVTSPLPNVTNNPYLGSACHFQPDLSFSQKIWRRIEQMSVLQYHFLMYG